MKRNRKVMAIIIVIVALCGSKITYAQINNEVVFKDKNLYDALCKYYSWDNSFTKEEASKLSNKVDHLLVLKNSQISDLEGLEYFKNITCIYLEGNDLINLKPLAKLQGLLLLSIKGNSIKGNKFANTLVNMGKIKNLQELDLDSNGLTSIDFVSNIGDVKKYSGISMVDNKISDISVLKACTNLDTLILSDNRITDVTPIKGLKKLTNYIDLRDNCIIDYSPIKPLFDKMYEDFDWENGIDRYDYYTNPVNFSINGEKIKFPYLTAYYKYQAYAEAVPLFKAFGGSAKYNKKTGTLICSYNGNEIILKDFSEKYTLNGEEKSLDYPMRRMQYDLAYIPVKDVCKMLGLKYNVDKYRKFYVGGGKYKYAPKLVEISKTRMN